MIERMNRQCHYNVGDDGEEWMTELFISTGTLPLIVEQLLVSEVWSSKIFPLLSEEQSVDEVKCYIRVPFSYYRDHH